MRETVDLATADGVCQTTVLKADTGTGPWPGVVFCIDGGGPREALNSMGQRIANAGYVVAIPDLFHREGSVLDALPQGMPKTTASVFAMFRDRVWRERWRSTFYASAVKHEHLRVDVGAVLEYFAHHPAVSKGPIGVTGYCMGGNCALRIAGLFGDRIGAAASFHGGDLASDQPDSPHHLASKITARVYAGCAPNDASCPDEMKRTLEKALSEAGVAHQIETYAGTVHGFCVPDTPPFNAQAAERHYRVLEQLFADTL